MLAPLTKVNRPHQRATGFAQAKETGRACHFELTGRPPVAELTPDCSNSVTMPATSGLKRFRPAGGVPRDRAGGKPVTTFGHHALVALCGNRRSSPDLQLP